MIHSVKELVEYNQSRNIQKLSHNGFSNRDGTIRMCKRVVMDFSFRSPALCKGNYRDGVQNAIVPERTVGPVPECACEVLPVRQY